MYNPDFWGRFVETIVDGLKSRFTFAGTIKIEHIKID